jgi:hypothetical protein
MGDHDSQQATAPAGEPMSTAPLCLTCAEILLARAAAWREGETAQAKAINAALRRHQTEAPEEGRIHMRMAWDLTE